jgi:general bacterial porin, GBP family
MKTKFAFAVVIYLTSSCAFSQTNLTLYGTADTGIQVSKFGNGTQYNLASGIADGSRLGFKGSEELGNGYKAIFVLESRVELDIGGQSNGMIGHGVGQNLVKGLPGSVANALGPVLQPTLVVNPSGAGFDRMSYLGLVTPMGAILAGRQYTPDYEVIAMADTFETGFAAQWGNILGGTGGFATPGVALRANDTIQYRLQLPNGIGVSAMYGFQNTGSLNLSKKFWGGNLRYQAAPWNAGIGYNREHDQNGNLSLVSMTAGGSYTLGDIKIFAGFHRMQNDNSVLVPLLTPSLGQALAGIVGENAKINAKSYTVGVQYKIGSGRVMASLSRLVDLKTTNNNANLLGLGYDYNLSKRTDIYTALGYAVNQHASQYALGGAGYYGGFTSEPGQNAGTLQMGIRHKF